MDEPEHDRVAADDRSAEQLNLRYWRLDQFISLGFDTLRAAALADAAVDLAQSTQTGRIGLPTRDRQPNPDLSSAATGLIAVPIEAACRTRGSLSSNEPLFERAVILARV
jgi:hypothetical protein